MITRLGLALLLMCMSNARAQSSPAEVMLQADEAEAHRTLTLKQLLLRANDPEQDRRNKDLYLLTNAAGAGAAFEGADATARWWHRNLRMYANIQRHATPGERVLVVAGSGHTAILRDFLRIDRRITARDIKPYL